MGVTIEVLLGKAEVGGSLSGLHKRKEMAHGCPLIDTIKCFRGKRESTGFTALM